ncbi:T9SS type A sorting domain-containing protein [Flavobacterium sp. Fl-318]|uniref:T9SS type A sorting domain-containing protein n=1 Tax=Flavobacterium cupriresistens TaxID=2893885 RepID=A0ABU4R6A8_9FLAO|nr:MULTISPECIES: T9SS type A sorting domain-containing protein [unclassified Flavobacterium]MDX6187736.1 T9SS type A sorting domain-containing protein [Flavobacterium sp. Fl-318]UFH42341.1 T9SS type A sorting domain-containing protein [Flavobacterium sp. F-323]
MRIKLLIIFFSTSLFASAQKLLFTYDLSGNQTIRELCLNCSNSGKKVNEDLKDIAALNAQDLLKFSQEDVISYYPNPVKEELYLTWQLTDEIYVSAIQIFNLNGQNLSSSTESKTTNNQNLSFRQYPAGVYFVTLQYSDGSQKNIKIIKN